MTGMKENNLFREDVQRNVKKKSMDVLRLYDTKMFLPVFMIQILFYFNTRKFMLASHRLHQVTNCIRSYTFNLYQFGETRPIMHHYICLFFDIDTEKTCTSPPPAMQYADMTYTDTHVTYTCHNNAVFADGSTTKTYTCSCASFEVNYYCIRESELIIEASVH